MYEGVLLTFEKDARRVTKNDRETLAFIEISSISVTSSIYKFLVNKSFWKILIQE